MDARVGDTLYFDFTTHNPSSGAVADADNTPTCAIFEDANDTAILTPTVVSRSAHTGVYRVPVVATTGNGFEIGKTYNIVVTAVVGGVTAKHVVATLLMYTGRITGTVLTDGSNAATTFKTDLASAIDDYYKDMFLVFVEGAALVGQVKQITGYTGSTNFVTVDAFTTTPTDTDKFLLLNA